MLEGAECRIQESSSFSRKRWDAYSTTINFRIPVHKLKLVNESIKQELINICKELMPLEVGFDVMNVDFSPIISKVETPQTLIKTLEETVISQEIVSQILPNDVKEKGKEMSEAYFYLYCVENSLRLFIEKVAKNKLGSDYFKVFKSNRNILKKISQRKEEEKKTSKRKGHQTRRTRGGKKQKRR